MRKKWSDLPIEERRRRSHTPANIAARKRYREKNRDKRNARERERRAKMTIEERRAARPPLEQRRETHKNWRRRNQDHVRAYGRVQRRKWVSMNPEAAYASQKRWRSNNIETARAGARRRQRRRWKTDLQYRLKVLLRGRLWDALAGRRKAGSAVDFLGCLIDDFKTYIESKFEPGMSWENYGRTGWHLDHIVPIALFDLAKPEHQRACFHFSNYQPMWATDNIRKGARVVGPQQLHLV